MFLFSSWKVNKMCEALKRELGIGVKLNPFFAPCFVRDPTFYDVRAFSTFSSRMRIPHSHFLRFRDRGIGKKSQNGISELKKNVQLMRVFLVHFVA